MQLNELVARYRLTPVAILVATGVAILWGWFAVQSSPVALSGVERVFVVQSGWGGGRIASELHAAGLIRSPLAMIIATNLTDTGDKLQAGSYLLAPTMTTREIVERIAAGAALSSDITVTIPEGMNVWEIDALLASRKLIVPGSFARQSYQGEGRYFPDTYRFSASVASGSRDFNDATRYITAFRSHFNVVAEKYTEEQIVIASMLEKEAKTAEDMRIVAGIIAQRRQLGMLLQIDATVGYGWCLARWMPMSSTANCDVTQAPIVYEIKKDGPYNTYMRLGLPVGPIANPGMVALDAAATPQKSDYLYYLSTRDGSELIYSKTLEEHNRNRAKYLGL